MTETQYIFGLGVGRCGTLSLANLLNSQKSASVGHEHMPLHWWPIVGDFHRAKDLLLEKAKTNKIVGNVAYLWIQYIPDIIRSFHNPKFIYIWRDKEEVVESFWLRNQEKIKSDIMQPRLWLSQYPFLRYPPTKDAISDIYDTYEGMINILAYKYPKQLYFINIESLNDDDSIRKLLSFVGIEKKDQIIVKKKMNVGGQSPVKLLRIA